ncbi:MAG: T9SS type A sorting domain-containing protein [Bacteroidota bacterium]
MYLRIGIFCLLYSFSFTFATTYTVTNTNDTGAGSLRQAMTDANGNAGRDSIVFDIAGLPPHTISAVTALPNIQDTLWIDGATQPDNGFGGTDPKIIIIPPPLPSTAAGLVLRAPASEICRIRFTGSYNGIQIFGGDSPDFLVEENVFDDFINNAVQVIGGTSGTIRTNYIGVYPGSTACIPGFAGNEAIMVINSSGVSVLDNTIACNRLSVSLTRSDNCIVTGNEIFSTGNDCDDFEATGITVTGNDNQIGGTAAGEANLISARNDAIIILDGGAGGIRNRVTGNEFQCISSNGIFLFGGGNNGKAAPVINFADGVVVSGTAQAGDVIEVFRQPDNTGVGCVLSAIPQGDLYYGSATADGAGNWVLADVFEGEVTATAYDATNGTSAFATPVSTGEAYATSVGSCLGAVLEANPILLQFEGIKDGQVSLSIYASQVDTHSEFRLERRVNSESWLTIHRQSFSPSPSSANSQLMKDEQPLIGVNYYRIAYQGENGEIKYSNIISAQIHGEDIRGIVLKENPSMEPTIMPLGASFPENTKVSVFDLSGRKVWEKQWSDSQSDIPIPLLPIADGIYHIRLSTSSSVFTKKWVKG